MDLPPRDALLDFAWLKRTHATEGYKALVDCVRRGAEIYGGPVTAVAEALMARPTLPPIWANGVDLRNGLAHRLLSSSWTTDPGGPQAHRRLGSSHCGLWMVPPDRRAEVLVKSSHPPCDPPLPELSALRLNAPLDCAWVGHTDGIWGCEVSLDGKYMVSASTDGDVAAWDMERGTLVARGRTGEREIRDCGITPDGRVVVSVHASGKITLWDLQTMRPLMSFDAPSFHPPSDDAQVLDQNAMLVTAGRARRFAISPDGSRLAVAGWEAVDVWDLWRLKRVGSLSARTGLPSGIVALRFFSDTELMIVGRRRDDRLQIVTWDFKEQLTKNPCLLQLPDGAHLTRAIVNPDGRYLVAVSHDQTAVVQVDGSEDAVIVPIGTFGQALAVSSDGSLAATCSVAHEHSEVFTPVVRVCCLPSLREVWRFDLQEHGCRDIACALAFAPDGRRLIIAGWDGVLRRVVLPIGGDASCPKSHLKA